LNFKAALSRSARELGILLLLIVLALFAQSKSNGNFLSHDNIVNVARLVGIYGIFAIGVAIVIITGGIDLSIGSMNAILAVVLAIWLTEKKWPPVLAIGAMMGLACVFGLLHGFLVTKVKLQPFIVTLCGLLIYRGAAQFVANDETKGFAENQSFAGQTAPRRDPAQYIRSPRRAAGRRAAAR